MAERILMNEYKALAKEDWVNIEVGFGRGGGCLSRLYSPTRIVDLFQLDEENIFSWNIGLIDLNPDSLYYSGYFRASMTFPRNYPYSPPGMYSVIYISCILLMKYQSINNQ